METEAIESGSNQKYKRLPIQNHFVGWQCRLRQYAMRNGEGRPTSGMRPDVFLEDGTFVATAVTLLLVPDLLQDSIRQFRYMALKTHDPQERYKKAVQLLSSTFYQNAESFGGLMTGLFSMNSKIVNRLTINQRCVLEFDFQQQKFRVIAGIKVMLKKKLEYEFTYWHNYLFNPYLPSDVIVIGFEPDWPEAIADPSLL